jgi:hypothetical protein
MKEGEMGGACSMRGEKWYAFKVLVRKTEVKRPLGALEVGGIIILKWILDK